MSIAVLERLRLESEVSGAVAGLVSAQARLDVCIVAMNRAEETVALCRQASGWDEGVEREALSIPALERGRLDRASSLAAAERLVAELRGAAGEARAALQAAEGVVARATAALERHARVEERREGRGGSQEPA